jgi:hypothetical protein
VGSLNFLRLSLKLTTGFADPRRDETGHPVSGYRAHRGFVSERRIRGPVRSCVGNSDISLVFREMRDTAGLPLEPSRVSQLRTVPHVRTSVRGPKKMGDPDFLPHRTRQHHVCGSLKGNRTMLNNATDLDRKSGGSPPLHFVPDPIICLFIRTGRTRISYFAIRATTSGASLRIESRMP